MDENAALLTGQIAGALMRLNAEVPESIGNIEILVDAQGNYRNEILVARPSGRYRVIVARIKEDS